MKQLILAMGVVVKGADVKFIATILACAALCGAAIATADNGSPKTSPETTMLKRILVEEKQQTIALNAMCRELVPPAEAPNSCYSR